MVTIAARYFAAEGRPRGFDYLRFYLAVSIVVWHAVEINNGRQAETEIWNSMIRPIIGMILPMFFALSGFLVAGSLTRSETIVSFLYLRVIRIFPALVVEVTLSAIVLGSLFTTHWFVDYI